MLSHSPFPKGKKRRAGGKCGRAASAGERSYEVFARLFQKAAGLAGSRAEPLRVEGEEPSRGRGRSPRSIPEWSGEKIYDTALQRGGKVVEFIMKKNALKREYKKETRR